MTQADVRDGVPGLEREAVHAAATPGGMRAELSADFRALFEASPVPLIVVAPPDWTIVAANDARLQVTSTSREEQIGRSIFEVFPDDPNDPNADGVRNLTASFQRVIATKSTDAMAVQRYAVPEPEGGFIERWWTPVNTPVLDENGEVSLIIHRAEDVTELVRLRGDAEARDQLARDQQTLIERLRASEAALRASEEFNRRVLTSSADCIKLLSLDGRLEFISEGGMCALEIEDFDTVKTAYWPDFWQGEERGKAVAAVEQARQGGAARFQGFAPTQKGSPRWWDVAVTPINGPDGAPEKLLSVSRDITATKQADERVHESEAQFRLMADAVPQIVWVTDAEGRVEFFNRQWSDYTGAPRPGSASEVTASHLHPDDAAATTEAFDEARRTGGVFAVEHRIRSKSGEYRWFLVRGEPYRDPGTGEIARWYGASIDIEARRAAEARLRELNETLEQQVEERTAERDRMWETSPDLMLVIDFQGRVRRSNPAWTTVLGYGPDELVGRHVNEFVAPDDHADTVEAYELAASGGKPKIVNRYRHKDGSLRWISWVAAPAGDVTYATGRDVTVEKAQEAELFKVDSARREADALYRAYFEHTAEALFVMGVHEDGGFTIEDLNPAHQASIGLLLGDVRGKRLDAVLPAELAEHVSTFYRQVVATGQVLQYRETFEFGGRATHWDTVLVPVPDAEGRIVRLIGSSRDLTAQVEAEEQLRQSQKLEAMGQLTGGVAHDFNNLLTPIIGSLDLLTRRGIGNERERRLIDGALQSAERAKTLVQRLLAFARRQPLQAAPVDLRSLVQGVTPLIDSTVGPQVHMRADIAADLPPVSADANQLEMALLNLAVNARDAMPAGGSLTIAAERERVSSPTEKLRSGDYVRLSVTDTGVGMDEATRARAIEPFFSTKGVGKGTGLGLSMVHGLAAQLGGGLSIDSAHGRGTTIELWLPVSNAEVETTLGSGSVGEAPRGRGKALLVDDEELVRMSTADMLSDLGFEVVEARSAEEAWRLVEGGTAPDLLVTDHLMPGMSGTDLAYRLRQGRPDLPVLIVSGYAEAEGAASDLPRLTKPFRNMELADKLDEVLRASA